tara:strand:- start:51 stop:1148 length:1098 start_codon:yes stop_codon:yes gene_type:complete
MTILNTLGRRALFTLDPESAHHLSILALKSGLLPSCRAAYDKNLAVQTAGLSFPNPIGLAAGYDKNGEVPGEILRLGFGFTEIGSVTPKPQAGNPKPRIFRLPANQGVINRLGFNNQGHQAVLKRLEKFENPHPGPIGINIGANKDSADRIADYTLGLNVFYDHADYLTINISSPNTPGLRGLQSRDSLGPLLDAVMAARNMQREAGKKHKPIFLKIAPDLTIGELEEIAEELNRHAMDGLIISNTTMARSSLRHEPDSNEAGGLSGKPLFERSTIVLAKMRKLVGPDMTLVGVGGIDCAETALEKICAGADILQLYTGFIYQGPGLVRSILKELSTLVARQGASSISQLRDRKLDEWAAKPIPA